MRFFRTSIRHKLISLLLISTILPIVTSIVITHFFTTSSLKHRAIKENTLLLSEGSINITHYLDTLNQATLVPYTNTTLDDILTHGTTAYDTNSNIFAALQLISRAAQGIYQVYFHMDKNDRSYLFYQGNLTEGTNDQAPPFPAHYIPYTSITESTHMSDLFGLHPLNPAPPRSVFTIHRPLYQVPESKQIGLISIDVDLSELQSLVTPLYMSGDEAVYVLDRSGKTIYASNASLIGKPLHTPWLTQILKESNTSGSLEWKDAAFSGIMMYAEIHADSTNWVIVKQIPYTYLYRQEQQLTYINTIVGGVFLAIAILAVLMVTLRFTGHIHELINQIRKIEYGHLHVPIEINREDEIGLLARRFRRMMRTINDLILREYKLELANTNNQLKMLQAQINPHFINNALQSIGSKALEYNAPKVYELISSLGQMMHYSTNMEDTVVPLQKEIEYVNYYLLLQKQRFDEDLEVQLDIQADTRSILVPKMMIQPIVENFFKHGYHTSDETGFLKLSTLIRDGKFYLIVEDNGSGIQPDRLTQLRKKLGHPDYHSIERGESIGLANVLIRLRLYYGEDAELSLSNREPHGLQVLLSFPLKKNESDNLTRSST